MMIILNLNVKYILYSKSILQKPLSCFKWSKRCLGCNITPRKFSSLSLKERSSTYGNHTTLLLSTPKTKMLQVTTRNMSMSWLNETVVTCMKWFQSISESVYVGKSMSYLQYFHDYFHLPWWLTIILSTIILRTTVTFTLSVYQNYILAKVENLTLEMDQQLEKLRIGIVEATHKFNWNKPYARKMYNRSAKQIWKGLIIRDNCHPMKAYILLIFQLPLWIILSMSFRNLATMMPRQDAAAQITFLQLSTEGFGWLPDLTDVDHSLILPVASALCNILNIDVSAVNRRYPQQKLPLYIGYTWKFLSIVLIPVAAHIPGAVVLYWATSSGICLAQRLLLLHPPVRRMCGIPLLPSENQNPYKHFFDILGNRYLFKEMKSKK